MRMYDLIMKKRNGAALTAEEIRYMITEYVAGRIPDYQMSAFLMAVYFKGMSEEETLAMTQAVAHSGDIVREAKSTNTLPEAWGIKRPSLSLPLWQPAEPRLLKCPEGAWVIREVP